MVILHLEVIYIHRFRKILNIYLTYFEIPAICQSYLIPWSQASCLDESDSLHRVCLNNAFAMPLLRKSRRKALLQTDRRKGVGASLCGDIIKFNKQKISLLDTPHSNHMEDVPPNRF